MTISNILNDISFDLASTTTGTSSSTGTTSKITYFNSKDRNA
jgi:hypothetical protein